MDLLDFKEYYIWYLFVALDIITFLAYALDKLLAMAHGRRVSERWLLTLTLLFGGVGALLGMVVCRHKIRKARFWFCVVLSIAMQSAFFYLYLF